jgi:hypothetical protein
MGTVFLILLIIIVILLSQCSKSGGENSSTNYSEYVEPTTSFSSSDRSSSKSDCATYSTNSKETTTDNNFSSAAETQKPDVYTSHGQAVTSTPPHRETSSLTPKATTYPPQTEYVNPPRTTLATKPPEKPKPETTVPKETLPVVHVNGIRLSTTASDNNVILSIGGTSLITPIISPISATNKNVSWSSNKPEIAYVNSKGKVTAMSPGKAIITATTADGKLTASCMVTVK